MNRTEVLFAALFAPSPTAGVGNLCPSKSFWTITPISPREYGHQWWELYSSDTCRAKGSPRLTYQVNWIFIVRKYCIFFKKNQQLTFHYSCHSCYSCLVQLKWIQQYNSMKLGESLLRSSCPLDRDGRINQFWFFQFLIFPTFSSLHFCSIFSSPENMSMF